MEIIRKVFINKKNNQASITLPRKVLLDSLKVKALPEKIKLKITIPKGDLI